MSIRISEVFDKYSVYDMCDIYDNFDKYLGINVIDIYDKVTDLENKVISKEVVIDYCRNKFGFKEFGKGINEIIDERVYDYNYFYKTLEIYSYKGISLLLIINYLNSLGKGGKVDKYYEEVLEKLGFSHVGSVVGGRDIMVILRTLNRNIIEYDKILAKINNLSTYDYQNIDYFARGLGDDLYPNKTLIGDGIDMTSICVRKRVIKSFN